MNTTTITNHTQYLPLVTRPVHVLHYQALQQINMQVTILHHVNNPFHCPHNYLTPIPQSLPILNYPILLTQTPDIHTPIQVIHYRLQLNSLLITTANNHRLDCQRLLLNAGQHAQPYNCVSIPPIREPYVRPGLEEQTYHRRLHPIVQMLISQLSESLSNWIFNSYLSVRFWNV